MSKYSRVGKLFGLKRHANAKPQVRSRLLVELLEDRLAPATFTVTDSSDNAADTGSIRYAINHLDTGAFASTNTINFAGSVTSPIKLSSALDIGQGVTIIGPGAGQLTISGNNNSRIFDVTSSSAFVVISGLTLTDGLAKFGNGGAILNAGTLVLQGDNITNSEAESSVGHAGGFGGAIANSGTLTLMNSTISGNTALGGAGASNYYSGGGAGGGGAGLGGGIYSSGTLNMTASTISGNSAIGGNGGITKDAGIGAGGGGNPGDGTGGYGGGSREHGGTGSFGSGGGGGGGGEFYAPGTKYNGSPAISDPPGAGGIGGFGGGGGGGGVFAFSTSNGGAGGSGGQYGGAGGQALNPTGSASAHFAAGGGGGGAGVGGAIFNQGGTLNLISGAISGNTVIGGAGGTSAGGAGSGGAAGLGVDPVIFNNDNGAVNAAPTFGAPSVTAGDDQAYFSSTVAITGFGPFTLVSTTGLPSGLSASVNGSTVTIAGTPSTPGTFSSCTVTVTDAFGDTSTSSDFTISINSSLAVGSLSATQWPEKDPGFSGTISVSGGTNPYSIRAQTGLPPGLTAALSGNSISITGTPMDAGTFSNGSVTVGDAAGATIDATFSITITAPLAVGNLTVTQWTQNQAGFNGALAITGGTAPFTVSAQSGLPTGLTAVINGNSIAFTGTPTKNAAFPSGSVTVKDAAGVSVTQTFSITINAPVLLGALSQTQWTVDRTGFGGALTISGGTGSYILTASSGLPPGLFASVSGDLLIFTGTPTTTGAFTSASVTVKDSVGGTATQTFSITINAAPSIGGLTPVQWTVDQSYDGAMTITGGTGPYALTSVPDFPPGLVATVNGNAIDITGTPLSTGTFFGTMSIQDAAGAAAAQSAGLIINAPPSLGALNVTQWTVSQSGFTGTLPIAGGTGPYTVEAQSGLPTGLTAVVSGNSVVFTGTPTAASPFLNGSVTIEDNAGATTTQSLGITVNPVPSLSGLSQRQWTANQPGFSSTATISGGTSLFTLTAQSGLPTGLTAALNGDTITITGTPTASGTFSAGNVTVRDSGGATVVFDVAIPINPAPTISALSQTTWTVAKTDFTGTMAISGGTDPFTLTAQSGLPTGLTATLSGNSIGFTGTPTTLGTFANGAVTIKDAVGAAATAHFSITIVKAPTIGSLTVTKWTVNQPGFTGALPISNGTGPFTVSAVSALPTGLTAVISGNSVVFTGTPTITGTFSSCRVTIDDAAGASATKTFTITINPALASTSLSPTQWTANQSRFSGTMTISGGTAPYSLTNQSGLPSGLTASLTGSTLSITGTPTAIGAYSSGSVTIQDSSGAIIVPSVSITINPVISATSSVPGGTADSAYDQTVTVTGGTAPYKTFAVTTFKGGGTGMTSSNITARAGAGTFVLSGTPTTAGTVTFTIGVTDNSGAIYKNTYNVSIIPVVNMKTTTLANNASTVVIAGIGFSTTKAADSVAFSDGAVGTVTAASASSLTVTFTTKPLNVGTLTAVATVNGVSSGSPVQVATVPTPPLAVGNLTQTQWTVNESGFTGTMTINGGTPPYSIDGAPTGLPPGMTASLDVSTISFSDTPTQTGTFNGSIEIEDSDGRTVTKTFSIKINAALAFVTTSLPGGRVGAAYSTTLQTSGGTPAVTFTLLTPSTLPPGLTLSTSGLISGKPTTKGSYPFTVVATDAAGDEFSDLFTILV